MGKDRIYWADSLKGVLILFVILGHAIQAVLGDGCFVNHAFNYIYSFHMPAFMAVSGYFANTVSNHMEPFVKHRSRTAWGGKLLKRRCLQLLIPYFSWSFIQWLIWGFEIGYTDRLLLIFMKPDAYFWFLWALFWINVIFILSQKISQKLEIDDLVSVVGVSVLLMGTMVFMEVRVCGFQFISYYFIFYALGYCIHRFSLLTKNFALYIILFFIWGFLASYWNMHELPSWFPSITHIPTSLIQYAYRGITAVVAIFFLFALFSNWLNGCKSKINVLLRQIGQSTLGIYAVHLILLNRIKHIVKILIPNSSEWMQICLIFFILASISVVIIEVLQRIKWTRILLLGKA